MRRMLAVGEFPAQHVEDRAAPVGGRDDEIGSVDLVVVQPHAGGPPVLGQDLLHLGFIMDHAAQIQVALFQGAGEGQRSAHREAGVAVVHVGQQHHAHHHGRFLPGEHLGHRLAQEWVLEFIGKLACGLGRPLRQGGHEGQHLHAELAPVLRPHQAPSAPGTWPTYRSR